MDGRAEAPAGAGTQEGAAASRHASGVRQGSCESEQAGEELLEKIAIHRNRNFPQKHACVGDKSPAGNFSWQQEQWEGKGLGSAGG